MRYSSKVALRADVQAEHDRLVALLDEIPQARHAEGGVWGDGWSLTDLVAHLSEWQGMFLAWHGAGQSDAEVALPAPGYKWSETPRLNRAIWAKHRGRSPLIVRAEFEQGYERICQLIDAATPKELLQPGVSRWTGRNALTTYLGANTASHYRFARKVIERWRRRGATSGRTSMRRRPNDR